jgi:hypothetical protein
MQRGQGFVGGSLSPIHLDTDECREGQDRWFPEIVAGTFTLWSNAWKQRYQVNERDHSLKGGKPKPGLSIQRSGNRELEQRFAAERWQRTQVS